MIPKLHLAMAQDDLRPVLCHALVTREHVVVTDSHVLVRHYTRDLFKDEQFRKSIPKGGVFFNEFTMKELAKRTAYHIEFASGQREIRITHAKHIKGVPIMRTRWVVEVPVQYDLKNYPNEEPKSPIEQFPDWKSVFPEVSDLEAIDNIAMKSSLMRNLSQAMGCEFDILRFWFQSTNGAIVAKGDNKDYNCTGLIMPVMPEEHTAYEGKIH